MKSQLLKKKLPSGTLAEWGKIVIAELGVSKRPRQEEGVRLPKLC